jgi:hypothetical protein
MNTYGYVLQNPVNAVDPLGLLTSSNGKECRIVGRRVVCDEDKSNSNKSCEERAQDAYQQCISSYKSITETCTNFLGLSGGFAASKLSGLAGQVEKGVGTGTGVVGGLEVGNKICSSIDKKVDTGTFCEVVRKNVLERCKDENCNKP